MALFLWLPVVVLLGGLLGAAPRSPARLGLNESAYSPWASVPSANLDQKNTIDGDVVHTPNDRLQAVSCADGRCMAVGAASTVIDGFDTVETLAESSTNGGEWTIAPSPNPAREDGDALAGVSCVSADLCMAVGTQQGGLSGEGATLAEFWDGTSWTTTQTPSPSNSSLLGVSCPDATTCYAVGQQTGGDGGVIEKGSLQGPYVNASAGTAVSGEQTSSGDGVYTAAWNAGAGTVTVTKHTSGGGSQDLFTVPATEGGFSPDSRTFVTATLAGAVEHVALYPLVLNATPIYTAGPTVTSSRLVFSPSGHYLLFAYTTPQQTFFEVTNTHGSDAQSANTFTSGGIDAASAPGSDNDSFGSVTYGFGPDDSRFLYGYVAPGAQSTDWRWTNLTQDAPQQINSFTMNATSGYAQFSPSAKFLALVSGTGTGQAGVNLFDSTSGSDVGAAGPADAGGSPPDLEAGTGGQTATIGSSTYTMTTQIDFAWSTIAAPQPSAVTPPTGVTAGPFDGEGLNAISCVSADDCTAVGEYLFNGTQTSTDERTIYGGPLVVHWDGSSWKVVYDPDSGKVSSDFGENGISCVPDNSTATGDACVIAAYAASSIGVIQLNPTGGWTSWRQVTGPKMASRINYYLNGISCLTASDCTAVGESGHGQGSGSNQNSMAVHYDGTQWSFESVPGVDGAGLDSVSCWAAGKCTAVGSTSGGADIPEVGFETDPAALVVEQGQAATGAVSVSAEDVAWGSQVTYSLALGGPAIPASGTVVFEGGGECSASLREGHASCSVLAESVGATPVEAYLVFYSGSGADQNLSGSWQGPEVTVEPPPTTTTARVSPSSATVGETVSYSAAVSSIGGTPDDGSVTFSIGSLSACTADVSLGGASCTSTAAPVGTDTVTARYKGTWDFGSSGGTAQLTVSPADGALATTTAVVTTPTGTSEGQTVTYTATVSADSGTPTGTVSFVVGAADLCTATLSGGTATCRSAAAPAGSDTVTAAYSGDPDFEPSTGEAALTVNTATAIPRLFVADSGNDTLTSYAASFNGNTAAASTISDDGSGTALDAPTATSFDGSGDLWVADCGTSSVTEYTAAELAPSGTPVPAAKLADDGSGTLSCPDALAFDSSGDLWVADSGSGLIAEYTPAELESLATTPGPSPAVTISDDGQSNLLAPNGLAFDPAGDLWVSDSTAEEVIEFTPGQLAAGGSPAPASRLVVQANALVFDSTGNLWVGLSGVIEDFTPEQLANLATQSMPQPTVQIDTGSSGELQDADALAFDSRGNLWVASAAQNTSSLLEFGAGQLAESGSVTPIDVVTGSRTGLAAPAGLAIEDGALPAGSANATPGTVVKGDSVTYSATIGGSAGTPTGTVAFSTGNVALCTATLSGGSGSCDSSAAPIGTDAVTAVYSGDAGYAGAALSTSVDVERPPADVGATARPSPATAGQNVDLAVTVGGPDGTPTGEVDFTYQGDALCSADLQDGVGSCVAAAPLAGDDTITASYSGDPDFAPSTGTLDLPVQAPGPAAPSVIVADEGSSLLQSFPLTSAGDALPTVTVSDSGSDDLREPDALAVDSSGDLWVATYGSGELLEYTPDQLAVDGSPAPAVVISSPNLDIPSALAFDSHGNLWEADSEDGDVVEFSKTQLGTSGHVTAAVTLTSSAFAQPAALAFDGDGDLWVLDSGSLDQFTPGQISATGSADPAVTVSDDGSSDLDGGAGMAFDFAGDLWVAARSGLAELAPTQLAASGTPSPVVTIGDDGSGALSQPSQIAFDDGGNLWVTSYGDAAVLEYAPDQLASSGQPTPAAVIGGPTTQLEEPAGLAILGASGAPPPPYPKALTVSRAGTGAGTVTSAPAGISCGTTCSADFAAGTSVTLTATPANGSVFSGWSGGCSGTGTCTVGMSSAQAVTATFLLAAPPPQTLTVTLAGTGSGHVGSSPGGIDCGATCSAAFASGTSVTLAASPGSGSLFTGWSGACSGTGPCNVAMTAAQSVTATFATAPPTLTVSTAGPGAGTVTSSPSGISCGTTCSSSFAEGTSVSLTATAAVGSVFAGWSGACSGTGSCVVTMTSGKSVTATFNLKPTPTGECVVPNVKGKTLAAARRAIANAHCTASITRAFSSSVKKNHVISQRPATGTRLAKNGKVDLVVSKGKRPRRH